MIIDISCIIALDTIVVSSNNMRHILKQSNDDDKPSKFITVCSLYVSFHLLTWQCET